MQVSSVRLPKFAVAVALAFLAGAVTFHFIATRFQIPAAGVAAVFPALAFLLTFEAARRALGLTYITEHVRPRLAVALIVGSILFLHVNVMAVASDVLRVPAPWSLGLTMLASVGVLNVCRTLEPSRSECEPDTYALNLDRKRAIGLVALALLAVLMRSAILPKIGPTDFSDPAVRLVEMEAAARALTVNGSLADPYPIPTGPTAHVSPLYAGILAINYVLFGVKTYWAHIVQAMIGILATAATICLTPFLAIRAGLAERTGWIAAVVLALMRDLMPFEDAGNWEQSITKLFLVVMVALLLMLRENWRDRIVLAATGALAGLTALLSPALLPAVALALGACALIESSKRREIARATAIIGLICLVLLTPWIIRNAVVLNAFVPTRSNMGLELAVGNNANATGIGMIDAVTAPHPHTHEDEAKKVIAMGEVNYMRMRSAEATQWISSNPIAFMKLTLTRARLFWFPDGHNFAGRSELGVAIRIGILWILGALSLLFAIDAARRRDPRRLILAAGLIGPCLIYLITHVDLRYRSTIHMLSGLLATEAALLVLGTLALIARGLRGRLSLPR